MFSSNTWTMTMTINLSDINHLNTMRGENIAKKTLQKIN